MLARDAELLGEMLRSHATSCVRNDVLPGVQLDLSVQRQRGGWRAQRIGEASGEATARHDVANAIVVDAIPQDIGKLETRALRQGRSVRGAERRQPEERSAGEFAGEGGCAPRLVAR